MTEKLEEKDKAAYRLLQIAHNSICYFFIHLCFNDYSIYFLIKRNNIIIYIKVITYLRIVKR